MDGWRDRERALRARGHEVSLLSAATWPEAGGVVALEPRPGEDVAAVRTIGRHPALFGYDPRPIWRALGESWDVLDIHEEPYAVATAEVLLLRWLRRNPVPYVVYSAQNIDKVYPFPVRWWERRILRGASGASVCNADAGRILVRKGLSGRPHVISLGVDPARFAPAAGAPDDGSTGPGQASTGIRVGYAGRLEWRKGVGVLLHAAAADPALHVDLVGSGPDEHALRALASRLDLTARVHFLGARSEADLPAFYHSIDVLAVPSLDTARWREQFGRVVVEAMACGTPVVSSDAGALPDVVGDAGIVVGQDDADALAAALVTATTDPSVRAGLVAAGLKRSSSAAWSTVAAAYEDLYEQAVAAGRGARGIPGVEVVVVAYGRADLVASCLAPLRQTTVTVVDNSSDRQVRASTDAAGARYLDPGFNGGFAAGVNVGLADRLVPGADVLLLNPDAVIDEPSIAALQRALRAQPDLASVGPAQVDGTGAAGRVGWPFPGPLRSWVDAIGLGRVADRPAYVIGSVLLLRAEAIDQVGGFDESFFLYAEETDWALRAARLGWRHEVVPEVTAVHLGAATSPDAGRRAAQFHASQERYLRKHHGPLGWQVARLGVLAGSIARCAALRGTRRGAARERVVLYTRGPERALRARSLGRPAAARSDAVTS
ncbi:MAG: glycosyltransferase [Ornithinibacter sp.]